MKDMETLCCLYITQRNKWQHRTASQGQERYRFCSSEVMSSSPSPVQIREANAHLAALHRRLEELEERLEEAEKTVREQADSLIRKDEQLHTATQQISHRKDQEIRQLQERLSEAEESVQRCQRCLKDRELLVAQLQHRCHLLDSICRSRPSLDALLALMAEAERLAGGSSDFTNSWGGVGAGGVGAGGVGEASVGNSPSRVSSNHKDFSLSEDDLDSQDTDLMGFGTTV